MTSREEIAAKLREVGEDNNDWSMGANAAFFKIDDIIGAQYKSYGFFFNRLANLIDPTCHDFGGEEGTNGESYDFACSACGWCGNITEPKYCPNCGARVVRDEIS